MGSLTRRPYLLVGFFHMIIGLLLFACGAVWLILTIVYWPVQGNRYDSAQDFIANNSWTQMDVGNQVWAWIVYTTQLWTGFWIMMAGSFAMCVKDQGCLEKVFLTMNTLTMIFFAPATIVISLELFFNTVIAKEEGASLDAFSFIYKHYPPAAKMFSDLELNSVEYPWILAFSVAGLSLGFIEFVLSLVSCSVCICCRPTRSYAY